MTDAALMWNTQLYTAKHAFVWKLAEKVLALLDAQRDEKILDLGCGSGELTQTIAEAGAHVVGVDQSPDMIAEARRRFPTLTFDVADARDFALPGPFDAVFSNAVLHWVKPPDAAIRCIWNALRPGGRLACEFGGKGNVSGLLAAATAAAGALGAASVPNPNYYPSIAEYTTLLEQQGFEVRSAELVDRPTPLEGADGPVNWVRMFRPELIESIPAERRDEFAARLADNARASLFHEGVWYADYRRLRVLAIK